LRQLATISGTVAAAKTEQEAEIVDLYEVGKIGRIGAPQQLLQADEELFTGGVRAK